MQKVIVSAKVPANEKEGTKELKADIGINMAVGLDEAVKAYGAEAVFSNAKKAWITSLQSNIRAGLKKGESPETIQKRLENVKMGEVLSTTKLDPVQAYMAKFASSTPEQQTKMIAELKQSAQKK